MGRPKRAARGGLIYHVLNRANARMAVFKKHADYDQSKVSGTFCACKTRLILVRSRHGKTEASCARRTDLPRAQPRECADGGFQEARGLRPIKGVRHLLRLQDAADSGTVSAWEDRSELRAAD